MDCYGVRPYGITTKTKKFQHISLVLRNLHWLPVTKRIEFKILTKTYKAMNGMALSYICDLAQVHHPQLKSLFCFQGSVIGRNSLPAEIKNVQTFFSLYKKAQNIFI